MAQTIPLSFTSASPFALAERPTSSQLVTEGSVRFLMVSGNRDDDGWGPIGALWLSADGLRGGFLVNPWALWEGSEVARGYRGALARGWSPERIFEYWRSETWTGSYEIDEEKGSETLALLAELVNAL